MKSCSLALSFLMVLFLDACGKKDEGKSPIPASEVQNFNEVTDALTFPSPRDANQITLDKIASGTYQLVQIKRFHQNPEIKYRSAFRHQLAVPGSFGKADTTYRSVDWGNIDLSLGRITTLAAKIPMVVECDGKNSDFEKFEYYIQQISHSKKEQKNHGKWVVAEEKQFTNWTQIAKIFDPKNLNGKTYSFKYPNRSDEKLYGFDSARGSIRQKGNSLLFFVEFERRKHKTDLVLEYRK